MGSLCQTWYIVQSRSTQARVCGLRFLSGKGVLVHAVLVPEAAVMYDHALGAYNNRNVFTWFWKLEV